MKFTRSHEWIRLDGNIGTVGITDHAQTELGEIVHVELPKLGRSVKAGDEACVLESTKAAADIYSPVSGKIIAINDALKTSTTPINEAAEDSGWLYRVELSKPQELDLLLSRQQYTQLINGV